MNYELHATVNVELRDGSTESYDLESLTFDSMIEKLGALERSIIAEQGLQELRAEDAKENNAEEF